MIEILHRGFGADIKMWRYGFYLHTECGEETIPMIQTLNVNGCFGACCKVDPSTVGMYSGIKDRLRKMVFDGDIVSFKHQDQKAAVLGVIKYGRYTDVDSFDNYDYIGWHIEVHGKCVSILQPCADGIEIEVIGNIHDNPELLEVSI